jgi:two-component system cell cycle response regulator
MRHLAESRRAAVALAALSAALFVCALELTVLDTALEHFVVYYLYNALVIAGPHPPYPSLADAFWLAVYPPLYAALVLLVRARTGVVRRSLWLDGVIGGLAIAAVGTAVVFQEVLRVTGGSKAAIATNLTYPLADLTVIALVVWILGASGWRPGRAWGLILAGLLVFSVSDCLYLYQTAVGTYSAGGPTDLGWVAGGVLLACAAWQPRERVRIAHDLEGLTVLLAPVGFGLVALGVLVYDHVSRINVLSLVLAAAAIIALHARLALTFAENLKILGRTRTEARTDELTGLGNRRQLTRDLERALADGQAGVLALFDLNGFKLYNDLFGHPAGDALLLRLGQQLTAFVSGRGTAYRMGGDEFCLFVRRLDAPSQVVVEGAAAALADQGEGFAIAAAYGWVDLPAETESVTEALRLADQRMYSQKHASRGSAGEQSSSVLLRAQAERHPHLGNHLEGVAALAEAVAIRLGLTGADLRQARLAAALHDVGKMAIPDEILEKPGKLSEDEWRFLRRHTIIGERILHAAPSLAPIASIVRSSHEHFDGNGYPDGLAASGIPLASRIVFVCDAFDAMLTDRPYSPALLVDAALAELQRCAGTQFDPAVVAIFCEVVRTSGRPPVAIAS